MRYAGVAHRDAALGAECAQFSPTKRPYGQVTRNAEGKWRAADGTLFDAQHQAYRHMRTLHERQRLGHATGGHDGGGAAGCVPTSPLCRAGWVMCDSHTGGP
jgi:hypothetical protein